MFTGLVNFELVDAERDELVSRRRSQLSSPPVKKRVALPPESEKEKANVSSPHGTDYTTGAGKVMVKHTLISHFSYTSPILIIF